MDETDPSVVKGFWGPRLSPSRDSPEQRPRKIIWNHPTKQRLYKPQCFWRKRKKSKNMSKKIVHDGFWILPPPVLVAWSRKSLNAEKIAEAWSQKKTIDFVGLFQGDQGQPNRGANLGFCHKKIQRFIEHVQNSENTSLGALIGQNGRGKKTPPNHRGKYEAKSNMEKFADKWAKTEIFIYSITQTKNSTSIYYQPAV